MVRVVRVRTRGREWNKTDDCHNTGREEGREERQRTRARNARPTRRRIASNENRKKHRLFRHGGVTQCSFVQTRRRLRDRGGVDPERADRGRGRARSESAGRDARARASSARSRCRRDERAHDRAARDEKRHNDARCVIKHAHAPARCLLCASILVLPTHTNIKEKRRELRRRSENGAVFRAEKQRHVGDAKAPTPLAHQ